MENKYDERLRETHARSLQENQRLYQLRSSEGKPTGVLERVILEQIKDEGENSCAGSRLDYFVHLIKN